MKTLSGSGFRMGQIVAWECEETGVLFREESEYRRHRGVLDRAAALRRRAEQDRNRDLELLEPLYRCRSFRGIEKWLVDHYPLVSKFGRTKWGGREKNSTLVGIHFHNLRFGEHSISHSAPIGQKTNWGSQDKDRPTSLTGWLGRVDLIYDGPRGDYDCLRAIGICTGGGGSANLDGKMKEKYPNGLAYSYELNLWKDDFPHLCSDKLSMTKHDLFHYNRAPLRYRISEWSRLLGNLDEILIGWSTPNPYSKIKGRDQFEYIGNVAAIHFADQYPYLVFESAMLTYKFREKLKDYFHHGMGDWRSSVLLDDRTYLTQDVEAAVLRKMNGEHSPDTRIVDLRERAARLKSEGLFPRLP